MASEQLLEAIEASDTDALLRIVDGMCSRRAWEELEEVRSRCQEAVTRGKQLWSIDEHIRYRFALEGPGSLAGAAVAEGPTRFTPGPITEVAASAHSWSELEPHLPPGPARAVVAHERVVRGEDLRGADVDPLVLELPLTLQAWEPDYPVPTYESDGVVLPTPGLPRWEMEILEGPATPADESEATEGLNRLVETWITESNGRVEATAVEGTARQAIRALGLGRALLAGVGHEPALAWMAWAAASGGAHGRRRGAALGRLDAWWAATHLAGITWPPEPDEMGEALAELQWWLWSDGARTGWWLGIAIEDPGDRLAWALAASDEVT